jgi:hypothetical protein
MPNNAQKLTYSASAAAFAMIWYGYILRNKERFSVSDRGSHRLDGLFIRKQADRFSFSTPYMTVSWSGEYAALPQSIPGLLSTAFNIN